ncbi:MAG: glycosyltransferase [Dehalococcoidales bacterium]|nr:glycosyltransferase [Dehalococcoidales bacterium]
MNGRPKVTVIIPIYNVEKYLRQCLKSIINQTLKDIEIICVNDGSTDKSAAILAEYAESDSRIKVIKQENKGAGSARCRGIEIAKGEYLSFLDSDDFFELNMLDKMYYNSKTKNTDITICRSKRYNNETNDYEPMNWSIKKSLLPEKDPFSYKDVLQYVFTFCIGWAWDKLYKTSFVKTNGLYFQNLTTANDAFFVFSSIVKANNISVIDDILICHRINNNKSLSQIRYKSVDDVFIACVSLRDELKSMHIYKEVEQAFLNLVLNLCVWSINTIPSPVHEVLYYKLRNKYFKEFGIDQHPQDYFNKQSEYQQYLKIKNNYYSEYLCSEMQKQHYTTKGTSISDNSDFKYIQNSWSFRIGSIITYLPHKIIGFFRCWKEYGLKYTLKATILEIRRVFQILKVWLKHA